MPMIDESGQTKSVHSPRVQGDEPAQRQAEPLNLPQTAVFHFQLPPVQKGKIVVDADFDTPSTIEMMAARRMRRAAKMSRARIDIDLPDID